MTSPRNPRRNAAVPGRPNPDQFVFWDQVHPTARVHYVLGNAAYAAVPTPGTLALAGVGLLAMSRRRRAASWRIAGVAPEI